MQQAQYSDLCEGVARQEKNQVKAFPQTSAVLNQGVSLN